MIQHPIAKPIDQLAGKSLKVDGQSTASCVNPGPPERSDTPEHIRKYRQSHKQQVGRTITHYGKVGDQFPNALQYKTDTSDHVGDLFSHKQGVNQFVNEIKEQKYQSKIKEPLGKKQDRNYVFPEQTMDPKHKFGSATINSEFTAKEVMFPQQPLEDVMKNKKDIIKNAFNMDVAEQKDRNYDWKFDKSQHVFGKPDIKELNQIKNCIKGDFHQDVYPQTKIIDQKQSDFTNYKQDQLGKNKNLAQSNQYYDQNTVFGQRNPAQTKQEEWSVGQTISGQPTYKQTETDNDLGRTNRHGFKNESKPGDENRVFGIPTIRDDKKKPVNQSLADPYSYGNEDSGIALIFPDKYNYRGVYREDFYQQRPVNEVREMFDEIGYKYNEGKFQGILKRAKFIEQNGNFAFVSIKAFEQAVLEMHND